MVLCVAQEYRDTLHGELLQGSSRNLDLTGLQHQCANIFQRDQDLLLLLDTELIVPEA